MSYRELRDRVEMLKKRLTPEVAEQAVKKLIEEEGEDIGGGINASRLVRHLLGDAHLSDQETMWAYGKLKVAFHGVFDKIPSLYYFEGD